MLEKQDKDFRGHRSDIAGRRRKMTDPSHFEKCYLEDLKILLPGRQSDPVR